MTLVSYFTFEHVSRASRHTPDWCTFRFTGDHGGTVEILSRDKVRRTRKVWNAIGTWARPKSVGTGHQTGSSVHVLLSENSFATRLAAACMARNWNATVFLGGNLFRDDNEFVSVAVLPSDGKRTNPNTIRNGGTQVRRTSLDLGLKPATGKAHGNSKPVKVARKRNDKVRTMSPKTRKRNTVIRIDPATLRTM